MNKKITLTLLLAFVTVGLIAQRPANRAVSASQLNKTSHFQQKLNQLYADDFHNLVEAKEVTPIGQNVASGKTSAITAVPMGRLSNAFSVLRAEQNQVFASDSMNMVAWIHRQDVTLYGGGTTQNGKYRYDLSIDGGFSFSTDIGAVQTTYTNYGRYPNITGFSAGAGSDPLNSKLVWNGATNKFPTPGWLGHVYGVADVATANPITSTEHYLFDGDPTLLPGGLCQGMYGEFWNVEFDANVDSIYVYKGDWNASTSDVLWARYASLAPDHNLGAGGVGIGPNVAFSPDGMSGYIVWLGDLVGGRDSSVLPCYYSTSDGGVTWDSAATEIQLGNIPWIVDSLTSFWVSIDSVTNDTIPAGSGLPTTGFDYDITVDGDGNLHIGAVIGNTPVGVAYSISSGIEKLMADVYTPDGGTTWEATYLAPVLAFRGEFGVPDNNGNLITMDNQCQASRTEDGTRVFFSWVDSDTSVIGFGESDNLAPNLRITGKRITDGHLTCWKMITDGDVIWDGKVLWPTLAPTVLTAPSKNRFYLPIVFTEMINNDQGAPCQGHYVGNDAQILESEFADPATLSLAFNSNCYGTFTSNTEPTAPTGVALHPSFPNPATNEVTFSFDLDEAQNATLTIRNLFGQVLRTVAEGNFTAGTHNVKVNTSDLADGVYLYSLEAGNTNYTNKMVIVK